MQQIALLCVDHRRLEQKLSATFFFAEEICHRQAFARILPWQYFRLSQQNRPTSDIDVNRRVF
jgi:hypothetical protein